MAWKSFGNSSFQGQEWWDEDEDDEEEEEEEELERVGTALISSNLMVTSCSSSLIWIASHCLPLQADCIGCRWFPLNQFCLSVQPMQRQVPLPNVAVHPIPFSNKGAILPTPFTVIG
jgi:hypothetical protein